MVISLSLLLHSRPCTMSPRSLLDNVSGHSFYYTLTLALRFIMVNIGSFMRGGAVLEYHCQVQICRVQLLLQ